MEVQRVLTILLIFGLISANCTIKLVIDMVRHGARAPTINSSFFPDINWDIPEELTPVGERQECLLGHLRRSQYIENNKVLPLSYDPTAIYARSTDTRRTLMSAQAYLIGLYPTGLPSLNANQMLHVYDRLKPPIDLEISNDIIKDLNEKPMPYSLPIIPIFSVNYSSEALLLSGDCPYIDYQITNYFKSSKYLELIQVKYRSAWQDIISLYPAITFDFLLRGVNAYLLADFIICAARDGRMPARLTWDHISKLRKFVGNAQTEIFSQDPIMNKIGLEKFTEEVLNYMAKTMAGNAKTKYVLYMAHDISLVVVMLGLQKINSSISMDSAAEFASNILFELDISQENPEKSTVTIFYNGNQILKDLYSNFVPQFKKLGVIGKPRVDACKVNLSGLREDWVNTNKTGIISDFRIIE